MNTISDNIDNWINGQYDSAYRLRVYGLTELIRISDQPVPTTIKRVPRKVALDDSFDLITWTRFIKLDVKDSEEDTFGATVINKQTAQLTLFIGIRSKYGYDWIAEFARDFPMSFAIDDYRYVYTAVSVDPDHDKNYRAELGETAYEKHRLTWNVFAVSLTVDFVLC